MTGRWRAIATTAWRESRNSRRRLALFMSSISIGVATLVAIDSFSGNVTRSIREQSRTLLGADLTLTSRESFTPAMNSLLDSLARGGVTVGRQTNFASMAITPGGETTRLAQVRAVTPEIPFYGKIETNPAGRWRQLQAGHNALADDALLIALRARVGDTLVLGYGRFAIIGTLQNVPGDVGIATAFGPRVYIPAKYVEETRLLSFGSRAEYEAALRVPSSVDPQGFIKSHRQLFDSARVRARTVQDTERNLTQAIDQLGRFLGIVGLVALLLGGVGVASAIHAYIVEKIDVVATLRCLGATGGQVLGIYVLEAAALGFVGAAAGVLLGVAAQFGLPRVLGDFLPVDVTVHLEPGALLTGLAIGIWVAVCFALLPLLAIRRVSPLQALRRDVGAGLGRRWLDLPRIGAAAALVASVVGIAISRTGQLRDGLAMSGAIAAAVVTLWLSAQLVSLLARRVLRPQWAFVVRQGIANLYRPANQTRAVMLSLGFGAFLISMLYLVQTNLLQQLAQTGAASPANVVFFDVQQDQAAGLDSVIRSSGAPVLQQVPIVPMRVAQINGKTTAELSRGRQSWALRREYRSSYRDTLITSERIVQGKWLTPARAGDTAAASEVSLERGVAEELGVKLGDRITWDVQGVRIPTMLTSLREVRWAQFEPNFFAIFSPSALESAPKSYVLLTRASDPGARGRLQRAAVERFPNVSTIDLSLIQDAVGRILSKVSVAIRFMALFSLATGALVLFSAVASSRRQRLREGVLLKTLGATRAQIGRIMLAEYAVLGVLGSATGMLLSIGGAWTVMHFVFKTTFTPALGPVLAIAAGMMLLTITIGFLSGRDVFAETPMAALREA